MKPKKSSKKNADPFQFVDHFHSARSSQSLIQGETALIFDERMAEHRCLWDAEYPERPERLTQPLQRCKELGLIDRCRRLPCRSVTDAELLTLHTQEHIDLLKTTAGSENVETLEKLSSKYDAIYVHPTTYDLAMLAAGSTIDLVDSVVKGNVTNGMALVRPPGHHALTNEFCGYCFYNNVGLAAKHAVDNLGLERILIVDWDVHHGQATQYMFYDDPRVLYLSVHRYEKGEFWPNLRESDSDFIGAGAGVGKNVNVPLNKVGMKNEDYAAVFHQLILPLATEYNPQLVIVSAGYDAAIGCFEGDMEITPAFYAHMTSSLMTLAQGKVAVVLEGGYCLKSLSEGVALTLRALLGDPSPKMIDPLLEPSDSIRESILNAIYSLKPHWKCFQFQPEHSDEKHVPTFDFLYETPTSRPESYPTRDWYPRHTSEQAKVLDEKIDRLILCTNLRHTKDKVCFAYDEKMLAHKVLLGDHPERPERIKSVYNTLTDFGLIQRMAKVSSRPATKEELALHTAEHIEEMHRLSQLDNDELYKASRKYSSVFFNKESNDAALIAAGSAIEVVDAIMKDEFRSGIAIVRPPGHHAETDGACGFCLYNNTAVAAKHAIEKFDLKRVLIVDWDVHHGNGIQHMFYEDDRVLYVSIHRYDNGGFFPCLAESNFDAVGEGKGEGYNVNIAWNRSGMGDAEYLAVFHQVVLPIAYQYNPELVLVASGFDAARGDPLGGCKVTPEGYGRMTQLLSNLAEGRVAVILEGGYNLEAISYSMALVAKALLGDPLPSPVLDRPLMRAGVDSIMNAIQTQKKYWSALKFAIEIVTPPVEEITKQMEAATISPSPTSSEYSSDPDTKKAPAVVPEPAVIPATLDAYMQLPEIQTLSDEGHLFAIYPKSWCPHLNNHVSPMPDSKWVDLKCSQCGEGAENWTCLKCYYVYCGRHVKGHMVEHNRASGHQMAVSHYDLSGWCYACDSYVDNSLLYPAKNELHRRKFGEEMPYAYSTIEVEGPSGSASS